MRSKNSTLFESREKVNGVDSFLEVVKCVQSNGKVTQEDLGRIAKETGIPTYKLVGGDSK